jgi:protein-L-isoaspartate(D-aspartate) O-methyltransferase
MDYAKSRKAMVENQLAARGITDLMVLDAMLKVPREEFVPDKGKSYAYDDRPLPIGHDQTISQPYMVALMTECLHLTGEEKVLEIGTGSGYQAGVLAKIAASVVTVERHRELAVRAERIFVDLGMDNIKVIVGDGSKGYQPDSPYGGIIVTAGAPHVPSTLVDQLADGGRLVIPVGDRFHQTLTVVTRVGKKTSEERLSGCVFVPLLGEEGWKVERRGPHWDENREDY